MQPMLLPLRRYAEFRGRSSRSEFWLFLLFLIVALALLGAVETILGIGGGYDRTVITYPGYYWADVRQHGGPLTGLFALAMLIPLLAVAVRRLHDSGHSGWWLLIGLIPAAGELVLLIFLVQRGDAGSNRFGPPSSD